MTSHKDLALGDSSDRRDPVFRPRMELRERWSTQLPSVLVVVTLFSLAVLPLFVARKINALRDKITSVAEPARQLVTETQGILALQTAAARGFALTGKSEFAEAHDSVRARRREAEHQLLSLVPLLGERTGEEVAAVMALRGTADALLDSLFEGRLSRQAYATRLNEQQARLESAIRGGLQIDQSLRRAIDLRVEGIERVERLGVILTVLLVLVTLVAAFLVARLGRRYRRLALELDESEARYRDIAEREHAAREDAEAAQHEAEERRSDLERVTESRARLLRGFTHDVKNPLGAADGFLSLLEEGVLGELAGKQKESVGRVRRSIRAALDLIHQLLELAKAEAGKLEIQCVRMQLQEVVSEVADEFKAQSDQARLKFQVELSEGTPPIESDPARVRQVFANLVSNAVKYTPEGGEIRIRVASSSDGKAPGPGVWVTAEVRDTGPGIPADKQRMLFLEFTRFDAKSAEGTGLGLAISQRIASALGGAITLESEPGDGSTFTLWLPLANPRET